MAKRDFLYIVSQVHVYCIHSYGRPCVVLGRGGGQAMAYCATSTQKYIMMEENVLCIKNIPKK